ncbi:MAG TPA: hypothetical protein VF691_06220 [Cytophagaceae bacterium]
MKYLIYVLLIFCLTSCRKQFPHARKEQSPRTRYTKTICPSGRYKALSKTKEKDLGRKNYKFRRAVPAADKRETLLDGDFDNGH